MPQWRSTCLVCVGREQQRKRKICEESKWSTILEILGFVLCWSCLLGFLSTTWMSVSISFLSFGKYSARIVLNRFLCLWSVSWFLLPQIPRFGVLCPHSLECYGHGHSFSFLLLTVSSFTDVLSFDVLGCFPLCFLFDLLNPLWGQWLF